MEIFNASVKGVIGRGVRRAFINGGDLFLEMSDRTIINLGRVVGDTGVGNKLTILGTVETADMIEEYVEDHELEITDGDCLFISDEQAVYCWCLRLERWVNMGGIVGQQGMTGAMGPAGRGISGITVNTTDVSGGNNIITIALDDGSTKSFNIKNGEKGEAASWIDIKGSVASRDELPQTGNTGGDGWVAEDNKHVYIYSASLGAFTDLGAIQGANGKDGQPGPQGETGQTGAAAYCLQAQLRLSASAWSDKTQTVGLDEILAEDAVIITPAPESYIEYSESYTRCTGQTAGSLTFTCTDVPTEDLTVNVLIMRGEVRQ